MRIAVIDIGTNATRLLIADIDPSGCIRTHLMREQITRLGYGMTKDKMLSEQAMQRVSQAVAGYQEICKKSDTKKIHLIATSAVREAKNKDQLLNLFQKQNQISGRVISGKEEAYLSFLGATSDLDQNDFLVCDIGGGSTELVYGNRNEIILKHSLPIGSRRLTTKFFPELLFSDQSIIKVEQHILHLLKGLPHIPPKIKHSVFTGGTATTIAMIDANIDISQAEKIHHYKLKYEKLGPMIDKLKSLDYPNRQKITGLVPERADVIITGALVTKTIMKFFNLTSTLTSLKDLMFGVLIEEYKNIE